jgi:hypothetical protein
VSAGSTGPLNDRDVHTLVSAFGRGEQPRVAVIAEHGGVSAGTKGALVGYEPESDEPFTVRLTVAGAERDVSFPAAVLAVVPRTRAEIIARSAGGDPQPAAEPAGGADPADEVRDAPSEGKRTGDDDAEEAGPARAKPKPAKAAARKAARPSAGDVVITVTIAGDGATVEAVHGTRKLVKGASLPVGAGHALAQVVNIESVTAAVEAVISEHRAAKQAEADQLRDRLASLEKELAEYQGIDAVDPA